MAQQLDESFSRGVSGAECGITGCFRWSHFLAKAFISSPLLRPAPDIMWYKKGGELPAGKTKPENFNKALRISNVSEEDSGEYFCLASNKMGSIRHTISVRVKGTSSLPLPFDLRSQELYGCVHGDGCAMRGGARGWMAVGGDALTC